MELKWDSHNQAAELGFRLEQAFFEKVHVCAQKAPTLMRFSAPLVATVSALIALTSKIFQVVEPIFKGLANLFGFCFTSKCNVSSAVRHFSHIVPAAWDLAFSPFSILCDFFVNIYGMAQNPKEFSYDVAAYNETCALDIEGHPSSEHNNARVSVVNGELFFIH